MISHDFPLTSQDFPLDSRCSPLDTNSPLTSSISHDFPLTSRSSPLNYRCLTRVYRCIQIHRSLPRFPTHFSRLRFWEIIELIVAIVRGAINHQYYCQLLEEITSIWSCLHTAPPTSLALRLSLYVATSATNICYIAC